jgi:hypothetical protein
MDLEQQILQAAKNGLNSAFEKELVGYNKPLSLLVQKVIDKNQSELFSLIDNEVVNLIGGTEFKQALKDELNRKLARTLIERMGGELESRVNELKQNPETRAKITLAISSIIREL